MTARSDLATRRRLAGRALAAVVAAGGGAGVVLASSSRLPIPQTGDELIETAADSPEVLVGALGRLVIGVLALQLAVAGIAALAGALAPTRVPLAVLRRVAVGPARWVATGTLAATLLVPRGAPLERHTVPVGAPATDAPDPLVLGRVQEAERDDVLDAPVPLELRLVIDAVPDDPVDLDDPAVSDEASDVAGGRAVTWTVEPGDHLWSIAERTVRASDPDASRRQVDRYWRRLIDANLDRLVVPGNPDLILPGQEILLPPAG